MVFIFRQTICLYYEYLQMLKREWYIIKLDTLKYHCVQHANSVVSIIENVSERLTHL